MTAQDVSYRLGPLGLAARERSEQERLATTTGQRTPACWPGPLDIHNFVHTLWGVRSTRATLLCTSGGSVRHAHQTVDTWGFHANNKTRSEQGFSHTIPNSQPLLLTTTDL